MNELKIGDPNGENNKAMVVAAIFLRIDNLSSYFSDEAKLDLRWMTENWANPRFGGRSEKANLNFSAFKSRLRVLKANVKYLPDEDELLGIEALLDNSDIL